jgi:hypothetical protein
LHHAAVAVRKTVAKKASEELGSRTALRRKRFQRDGGQGQVLMRGEDVKHPVAQEAAKSVLDAGMVSSFERRGKIAVET